MNEQDEEYVAQLATQLDDLGVGPAVRAFVAGVTSRRPVLSDRRGEYVSLRPAVDRAIAVYVHANRVSIACEPTKASSLAWPGRKQTATPATTYLVLGEDQIAEARVQAEELTIEALDWRNAGPTQAMGRPHSPARGRVEDVCPDCWCVITPAGTCCCDE